MLLRICTRTFLSLAILAAAACGDNGSSGDDAGIATDGNTTGIDAAINTPDATPPTADAAPRPDAAVPTCTPTSTTNLRLEAVANGFANPLFLTSPAGDPRLFIVERTGTIQIVENGARVVTPFLDISGRVETLGSEQGLLGLAFHPDYATNGKFYVDYIDTSTNDTVVAEYTVSANPNVANTTERRLLGIVQPYSNHNGGSMMFGPDGYLYIGVGDGGSGGDPMNYAQRTTELLGSMLRIDVDTGDPYGIPTSNPYSSSANGPTDPRPEIWAYGLRNPWRFSFDRMTGDLYIGDVGQNAVEEIDVQPAASVGGENYGWRVMEASDCYSPSTGCDMSGKVLPVAEYSHGAGRCSVTGGYVYRGSCMTAMPGQYFYGDYCSNQVWTLSWPSNTTPVDQTTNLDSGGDLGGITSFGEDAFGELYITSYNGIVYKIVPDTM